MKQLLTSLLLLFTAVAGMAQKPKTVTITGQVSGDTKGYDYILFYTNDSPVDSIPIQNGKFVLKVPYTENFVQILVTQYDQKVKRSYKPFVLLIDGPGEIHIDMDIAKGFSDATIKGAPTAAAYAEFRKQQDLNYKKVDEGVTALYGESYTSNKDPLYEKLFTSRDSLTNLYMGALVNEFVTAHKNEFVGVYVLSGVGKSVMQIDRLDSTWKSLSPKMQKSVHGEKIAAYLRGVKNTGIGAKVKNFSLKTPEGKLVSFDQFKGKYVWVDFWASWCGPCKQAFPHMREVYAKYKEKGLEILGISADTKIDPWLKILPTLNNPWTQVWDNKNIMSEFAVTAFPTSFLIDPDGRIVLKEIGYTPGEQSSMDKKLEEVLGDKGSAVQKTTPAVPMLKQQ